MIKRLLVGCIAFGLVFIGGATADASSPPVTTTRTTHGVVETFVDVLPSCDGGGTRYVITTTSNRIEHKTKFDDGRRHLTFTDTGTFIAVPKADADGVSYTGHFTAWFGLNVNGSTVNSTFTFNVSGTGSDGSTFRNHAAGHFLQRPDGTVQQFFKCH